MGGLTALGTALYSIGIPQNSIVQYETEVKNGKLLLVAHGTADEVQRARNCCIRPEWRQRQFMPNRPPSACNPVWENMRWTSTGRKHTLPNTIRIGRNRRS